MNIQRKAKQQLIRKIVISLILILAAIGAFDSKPSPTLILRSIIPLTLAIVILVRSVYNHFKKPFYCMFQNNIFTIKYFNQKDLMIYTSDIVAIDSLIHSKNSAKMIIKFNYGSTIKKISIKKSEWDRFPEFVQYVEKSIDQQVAFSIYETNSTMTITLGKLDRNLNWIELLTNRKSIKKIFSEIINKALIFRILAAVIFFLATYFIVDDSIKGVLLKILIIIGLVFLTLYLVVSFIFRLKGYSKIESVIFLFGGILFIMFFGTQALLGIFLLVDTLY